MKSTLTGELQVLLDSANIAREDGRIDHSRHHYSELRENLIARGDIYNLGEACQLSGVLEMMAMQLDAAKALLSMAIGLYLVQDMHDDVAAARRDLAGVYYRAGKYEEANTELDRAREHVTPNSAPVRYAVNMCLKAEVLACDEGGHPAAVSVAKSAWSAVRNVPNDEAWFQKLSVLLSLAVVACKQDDYGTFAQAVNDINDLTRWAGDRVKRHRAAAVKMVHAMHWEGTHQHPSTAEAFVVAAVRMWLADMPEEVVKWEYHRYLGDQVLPWEEALERARQR